MVHSKAWLQSQSRSFLVEPELFLKFSWSQSWWLIQEFWLRTLSEMHHPTLFAKHAEKRGSLNWLTAPYYCQL